MNTDKLSIILAGAITFALIVGLAMMLGGIVEVLGG